MATKDKTNTFNKENLDAISESLERASSGCAPSVLAALPRFGQAIQVARSLNVMRRALTQEIVEEVFMPLKGTPLGFLTDEATRGPSYTRKDYLASEVRDVVMEALIRGFRPVNNEFNMLAGRFYPAKAGIFRQVTEWPGLTGFREAYAVPAMKDGDALVACRATWKRDGASEKIACDIVKMDDGSTMDLRIPVRVNRGMGPDAILGKAQRKLYARVFSMLSGVSLPEDEPDADAIPATGNDVAGNPFTAATIDNKAAT